MNNSNNVKLNPRKTFWKCRTCSRTMFHLLNKEFDNHKNIEEQASDLLSGGIGLKGYQCGMMWGSALAVGVESFHRYNNHNQAIVAAITASHYLVESFTKRTKTVNCREISGADFTKKLDLMLYIVKTILRGFNNPCFNLVVKWTPEAIRAANRGLSEKPIQYKQPCLSCASEVVKKMGASDEETITVAGLAGGIGLSGNACGALSAVIWLKMLNWHRKHPGKTAAFFNNQEIKKILRAFYIQTDSEMICSKICGKYFETIDEHSQYLRNGGCEKLINALVKL